jgi:hypothetical protein
MMAIQNPSSPSQQIPEWIAPFLAVMLLIVVSGALLLPLVRAWARRIEGRGADADLHADVAHLRERVAELEASDTHMAELEERLDFAERMLAQRNDAPQLPPHRTPA